ncbi:MAG: apolipoprotein N-acyltransferase [Polyangiaceae bacterium]
MHRPIKGALGCAGAVLSGLLYWLAFPGVDVWPLTFVAWVPLIVAMRGQSVRRTTLLGWIAGVTMNFAGFFWLLGMLRTFSGFPLPVCLFFDLVVCGYQGGRIALLGWLYGRAERRGWPAAPVFAGAFAASELLYPLLFPWYYAATAHKAPVLTQTADLGGPILVGLVLVAVNLALAEVVMAARDRRRPARTPLAVGAGALVAACAYGTIRIGSVDAAAQAAPSAVVGVVQANMGLMEKRTQYDDGVRRHLRLSQDLRERGADFLVWSETSAMRPAYDEDYKVELRAVASHIGLPTVFGAVIVKRVDDERGYVLYNSGLSSDANGRIEGRYDKQYLLAFGEYLPFGDSLPVLYKWSPNSGHFTPGKSFDSLPLVVGGVAHPATVLICYEDILPRFTNTAVRQGDPELLVNMTNDAWFGDTAEPREHLALSEMRAVEHRRYLVRGTNSVVSAVVDPVGRVIAQSGTFRQEGILATIHWMRSRTLYELLGDWPWLLCSLAMAVAAWKRRPAPGPVPSAATVG